MNLAAETSADDVAAAVLVRVPGIDQMQLHKLLYLVQAASLAWFGTRAFPGRIEAWKYGPVVRQVAGHYHQFERAPIMAPVAGDPEHISNRTEWVVERIVQEYGHLSGPQLARLVKAEGAPWRTARGVLPDNAPSEAEIEEPVIAEYHSRYGIAPVKPDAAERDLAQRFLDGDDDALAQMFENSTGVRPEVG